MSEIRALAAVSAALLTLGVFFTLGAPSPFSGQELEPGDDDFNSTSYDNPQDVFKLADGLFNDVSAIATSGNPILLALASLFVIIIVYAVIKVLPLT